MSNPLSSKSPPDEVLRYAPNRARHPGYRSTQAGFSHSGFPAEQKPSHHPMVHVFAPEQLRRPRSDNHTLTMLLRASVVVGVAGASLALFIGYLAIQRDRPEAGASTSGRFKGISDVAAVVRTAITQSPGPVAAPQQPDPPAVKGVPVQARAPEPGPAAPEVAADRGSGPNLASVDSAPAAAPPPAPAPNVAALPPELPPAPPEPVHKGPQLSDGELATLMARGRRFMESGDLSSARPVYRRAAEAGSAQAALALAETYDPVIMRQRRVIGMVPDIKQARHWYERARDLGSVEAPTRLQRLAGQ